VLVVSDPTPATPRWLSMWWSRGASHNTCTTVPGLLIKRDRESAAEPDARCHVILTRYFAAWCEQLRWRLR
jgi:hypothetical protein